MFAYCISAAYQEGACRGASQAPRSRHVERPRVRSKNAYIALVTAFVSACSLANSREILDFTIAKLEPIAAKAVAAALPAAAHPLSGAGAGDLGVCDNRGGDFLAHETAPLMLFYSRSRRK